MPRSAPQSRSSVATPTVARITRAERRRQLLAHAAHVFAERGYLNTTTELVAEVAEVSEVIFAKYFEDVPALFHGVLEAARLTMIGRWRAATEVMADPLARFHAVAEMLLRDARSGSPELLLVFRALAECESEAALAPLRSFLMDCETFLAGIISEGQQAGVFRRSPDPRDGAWLLLHAALGQAATRPLRLAPLGEADSLSRAVEGLMHGLLKTDV